MAAPAAGAAAPEAAGASGSSAASTASSAANIASGLDFGGNMLWNAVSAIQTKRMQARSQKFNERMWRNRYQYAVEDLKKAGLNPMLAYMQSQSGASGPGGSSGSFNSSRVAESVKQKSEGQLIAERINTERSIQSANSAVAQKNISDAALNLKKGKLTEADTKKALQEVIKLYYENEVRKSVSTPFELLNKTPSKAEEFGRKLGKKGGKKYQFGPKERALIESKKRKKVKSAKEEILLKKIMKGEYK